MSLVLSIVEDLASSLLKLVPAALSDLLGMATRPVVLLGQAGVATGTATGATVALVTADGAAPLLDLKDEARGKVPGGRPVLTRSWQAVAIGA